MNTPNTCSAQIPQPAAQPVTTAMERLNILNEDMAQIVKVIEQRLASVLAVVPVEPNQKCSPTMVERLTSPLASQLRKEGDKLDGSINKLREILDRIELN